MCFLTTSTFCFLGDRSAPILLKMLSVLPMQSTISLFILSFFSVVVLEYLKVYLSLVEILNSEVTSTVNLFDLFNYLI